jgi:hypothetical protein
MSCIELQRSDAGADVQGATMPTTQSEHDKKRRDPVSPRTGGDSEPHVPEHEPADLEDDQADSGPDRDRKELGV